MNSARKNWRGALIALLSFALIALLVIATPSPTPMASSHTKAPGIVATVNNEPPIVEIDPLRALIIEVINTCVKSDELTEPVIKAVIQSLCAGDKGSVRNAELNAFATYIYDPYDPSGLEPTYNCHANRKLLVEAGIKSKFDVNKLNIEGFVPCPNGALHVRVNHGRLELVQNTSPVVINSNHSRDKIEAEDGWYVGLTPAATIATTVVDGKVLETYTFKRLVYDYAYGGLVMYFVLEDNYWSAEPNVNDMTFDTNKTYDVVFTWHDSSTRSKTAELPFTWDCVPRYPSGPALKSC